MENKGNIKYSVLMPLWYKEREDYLELSLRSIAGQTKKPDEIVLIQDHEIADSMQGLIQGIAEDYDVAINIYKNFDLDALGLSAVLAFGVTKCRNVIIARMDTDDIAMPERCEKQLAIFREAPQMCIVGAWVNEFSSDIHTVTGVRKVPGTNVDIVRYSKLRCPFNHPTVMFRKDVILELGNYNASIRKAEDYDLWYRALKKAHPVYNIQEPLLWLRVGKEQEKRRKDIAHYQARLKLKKLMLRDGYMNLWEYCWILFVEAMNHYLPAAIANIIKQRVMD